MSRAHFPLDFTKLPPLTLLILVLPLPQDCTPKQQQIDRVLGLVMTSIGNVHIRAFEYFTLEYVKSADKLSQC